MNTEKFSDSKPVELIAPATALAASVTGPSIDTQFYNSLTAALDLTTLSAGSVDSIKFQESADNSVWADVPVDDSLFYPDGFPYSAPALIHVGTVAKERYVRLVITCTGPTGTAVCLGLLQDSLTKPMVKASSVLADADIVSPGQTADAVTTPAKRT